MNQVPTQMKDKSADDFRRFCLSQVGQITAQYDFRGWLWLLGTSPPLAFIRSGKSDYQRWDSDSWERPTPAAQHGGCAKRAENQRYDVFRSPVV